jgi:glycosyltransferase involved in cell wall biosynthesis
LDGEIRLQGRSCENKPQQHLAEFILKIAQVAPLFESVPPQSYGGTERVVSYLAEALVDLGHEVTLFASGDSTTRARLVPIVKHSLRLDPQRPDWLPWHMILVDEVFRRADEFDTIHFHVDYVQANGARLTRTPCLTTTHGRLDSPDLAAFLRHFGNQNLVSISNRQRDPLPWYRGWLGTVHHGLPRDLYRFNPEPQDYFAFVGRISPEKRVDRAIEIAIACNVRLRIAAKIDRADQAYLDQRIRRLLDHPLVEFVGEIDDAQKNVFIGNARALLFPIDWPEPFGMVMIEAFACGTPVIAYRCGSVPEVVEHGVTGFIVENQRQAIAAAHSIDRIDRQACRSAFEERFTSINMARRYVDIYHSLRPAVTVSAYGVSAQRGTMLPIAPALPAIQAPHADPEAAEDANLARMAAAASQLPVSHTITSEPTAGSK